MNIPLIISATLIITSMAACSNGYISICRTAKLIVGGGTPPTADAAVGIPANRKMGNGNFRF